MHEPVVLMLYRQLHFLDFISPHVMESGIRDVFACGIRDPGYSQFWNPQSWTLDSRMQYKESGIPLMIGIRNPGFNDKDWNPVPGIRNPRRGIQNPRLSWIPLHGAIYSLGLARAWARLSSVDFLLFFHLCVANFLSCVVICPPALQIQNQNLGQN